MGYNISYCRWYGESMTGGVAVATEWAGKKKEEQQSERTGKSMEYLP